MKVLAKKAGQSIDPGQYEAEVTGIKEKDTEFGLSYIWEFHIFEPRVAGKVISDYITVSCPTTVKLTNHPQNKLLGLLSAMGYIFAEGEHIDLDVYIGSKLVLIVVSRQKGEMVFNRVQSFLPYVE